MTGVLLTALMGIALGVRSHLQQQWSLEAQRILAQDLLTRAQEAVRLYRQEQADMLPLEAETRKLRETAQRKFLEQDRYRELRTQETRISSLRAQRETPFYQILNWVREAEQLAPALEGGGPILAELYLVRWEEARQAGEKGNRGLPGGAPRELRASGDCMHVGMATRERDRQAGKARE